MQLQAQASMSPSPRLTPRLPPPVNWGLRGHGAWSSVLGLWAGEEHSGLFPLAGQAQGAWLSSQVAGVPASPRPRRASLCPTRAPPHPPPSPHGALTTAHPQVQSLHSLHENGALVPLSDALYVTGGRWQGMDGDYHVEMEAYDPGRNAWTRHGSLPRLWLYHGACTVFLDVSRWTQPFGPAQEH